MPIAAARYVCTAVIDPAHSITAQIDDLRTSIAAGGAPRPTEPPAGRPLAG